ncbi:hypothetical protein [Streptomyces sp. NPDC017868]
MSGQGEPTGSEATGQEAAVVAEGPAPAAPATKTGGGHKVGLALGLEP